MRTAIALSMSLVVAWATPATAQTINPPDSDWTRVMDLGHGERVIVVRRSSFGGPRHFVKATDYDLTVLNLTDPAIPSVAKSQLLNLARQYSDDFGALQKRGTLLLNANVRLSAEGLFVDDRKVAELGQIVEVIPRPEVRRISETGRRGSVAAAVAGAAGGVLLGTQLGPRLAMKPCGASCADEHTMMWLSLVGLPAAGAAGGYYFTAKPPRVIYREP
jgi:hypothetical protein